MAETMASSETAETLDGAMIEPRLDNLEEALGEAGRKIEELTGIMQRLDVKFSNGLTTHKTLLDASTKGLADLRPRLGKLETTVAGFDAVYDAKLLELLKPLEDDLAVLVAEQAGFRERQGDLWNTADAEAERLRGHLADLMQARRHIDRGLQQRLDDQQKNEERLAQLEGLVRGIAELPERVESLDGKVEQGRSAASVVAERISSLTASTERVFEAEIDLVRKLQGLFEVQRATYRLMGVIGIGAGLLGGALAGVIGMLGGRLW